MQGDLKQKYLPGMLSLAGNKSWRLVARSLLSDITPTSLHAAQRTSRSLGSGRKLFTKTLLGVESEVVSESRQENLSVQTWARLKEHQLFLDFLADGAIRG